jgi:hypothetical protein
MQAQTRAYRFSKRESNPSLRRSNRGRSLFFKVPDVNRHRAVKPADAVHGAFVARRFRQ